MKVVMSLSVHGDIHLVPTPLITLPPMDFTYPSQFSIMHTTIVHNSYNPPYYWRSALLSAPVESGVVSITITILSKRDGYIRFGLMDYSSPIPAIGEELGNYVKNSVGFEKSGNLYYNTPSSRSHECSHSRLNEGGCVRMEVDLEATP
ncbi:hypothetical protein BLNAU_13945 [Blattamonas nauphoetae]|uniref:Uncharacterized protein n=1 Tax=Blattamonas nauphoetae TaxID=2049346 RepID=A0ABQ9XKG3_9EUKA|nr:hypothetical protein BLNAU_13945 [Blattamonas nauphoetae]